jgi:hypothetical protein
MIADQLMAIFWVNSDMKSPLIARCWLILVDGLPSACCPVKLMACYASANLSHETQPSPRCKSSLASSGREAANRVHISPVAVVSRDAGGRR